VPLRPLSHKGLFMGVRVTGMVSDFAQWLGNIVNAVWTVGQALRVTLRYWMVTYRRDRKTFVEQFEYPELPVPIAPRYRGFHRFDLTTCIACERCARDCPVDCIYIGKERPEGRKGFRVKSFVIDYTKCMLCGICTESCPVDCIFMGSSHDLSNYSREGCIVDFARLPLEIAWGRATLTPAAVACSKNVVKAVHDGPGQ
jgi:NADH-quinone oxidoreductase subunit I